MTASMIKGSPGVVYKITNIINDKVYVGQTTQGMDVRFLRHKLDARNNKDTVLCRAIRKHGEGNFTIVKIDEAVDYAELDKREDLWIHELNSFVNFEDSSGYNMRFGGQGIPRHLNRALKLTDDVIRDVIECSLTGEYSVVLLAKKFGVSSSTMNNLFNPLHPQYKHSIRIITPGLFEKALAIVRKRGFEDGLVKLSSAKTKGNHHFWGLKGADSPLSKPVEQLDKDTLEVLRVFPSATEAAEFHGLYDSSKIAMVCRGKRKSSAGYSWKFANNKEEFAQ